MIAVLSAAMMLAPIVNIKAASTDVVDTSKTGSITIHKYDMTAAKQAGVNTSQFTPTGKQDAAAEAALEKYAIKGVEFSYLRVGDVEQQSENGKIQMIYELPTTIQQILGLTSSDAAKTEGSKTYFTSQQINEKLAKALEDNTVTKDKLEDYMGKNGTAMDETNANGVTSKDKLPLGLYLIVETKAPENVTYTINPWFVQLPSTDSKGDDWFYDVICYPKNETGNPTLDKRVRNNPDQDNVTTANTDRLADFTSARNEYKYQSTVTASKAERLDYQFISKLPHITSSTTYLSTYTFNDTMAKAGLNELNKKYSDKYIVVYYTAKVNTDDSVILGDKGNPNDVSLMWKRTNTNYYDILKDKCIVYSYGYDLTKKFSDSKGDATKVKFVVKNKTDNYYLVARADRAGVYQVTGKSAKEADATQFSPSSDGKLVINGIEGDEYGFTETHSDAGYSLLKKEVIVKVKETKADITPTEANITGIQSKSDADSTANDGVPNGSVLKNDVTVQTTAASATVDETKATMTKHDDSGNAYINMQITNQKQFMLPMTGGAGNYLLIIAGVVVAGCGILILNKNRGRSQR
mgnify:CR=1 FL=1